MVADSAFHHTSETTAAPQQLSLKQLIAQIKDLQVGSEFHLGGESVAHAPHPAVDDMRRVFRALVKKFVQKHPGASTAQFVLELKRGRVPSAGYPHDSLPRVQADLAEIATQDPSYLDVI